MFRTLAASISLSILVMFASVAQAAIPVAVIDKETPSLAPMLKTVLPAIVNISTSGMVVQKDNPLLDDPLFRYFLKDYDLDTLPKERRTQSIGSGVIINAAKGYVITNHHVIKDADQIFVVLKDKRKIKAKLIGSDEETDIAMLQITASDLTEIKIGNSDALSVGDFALAIGNPFGLGHTVTSGIVSALGRTGLGIEGYEDFIQTDASINPGNSGGALINLKGELVGINTAILAPNGGNIGIGFSIPINMVKQVMQQLLDKGSIQRGQLGIHIQDVTSDLADALNIKANEGALVAKVVEGSPAGKAGIKAGDVVTKFNGKAVNGSSELKNMVGFTPIGSVAEIEVLRDGQPKAFKIKIEKRPVAKKEVEVAKSIPALDGAKFSPLSSIHPLYSELKKGVVVVEVKKESSAWNAGIREDDVILAVNKQPISTVDDLIKIVKGSKNGILMHLRRGDAALYIVVK
ncbi:MAG: DegQ family serine endoprotease [Alphaproteobacteria bacterium]|nr:DegQ family serine endoprotease [Alphaproteobacteria bacterium]